LEPGSILDPGSRILYQAQLVREILDLGSRGRIVDGDTLCTL
jgi:hypothetical protein